MFINLYTCRLADFKGFKKLLTVNFPLLKKLNKFADPNKKSPDGGIGRRAWLRAMFHPLECKFDSCSGH